MMQLILCIEKALARDKGQFLYGSKKKNLLMKLQGFSLMGIG